MIDNLYLLAVLHIDIFCIDQVQSPLPFLIFPLLQVNPFFPTSGSLTFISSF